MKKLTPIAVLCAACQGTPGTPVSEVTVRAEAPPQDSVVRAELPEPPPFELWPAGAAASGFADEWMSPHYAALFVEGRLFRYRVERESTLWDPDDPRADARGHVKSRTTSELTCKVSQVRNEGDTRIATVDCGNEGNAGYVLGMEVTPAAHYVATRDGLYRYLISESVPATHDPKNIVLRRDAKPYQQREETPEGEISEAVTHAGGVWCRVEDVMIGDASFFTYCFDARRGLVKQIGGWSGATSHSATFTLR